MTSDSTAFKILCFSSWKTSANIHTTVWIIFGSHHIQSSKPI